VVASTARSAAMKLRGDASGSLVSGVVARREIFGVATTMNWRDCGMLDQLWNEHERIG
jgi:hypothetical protein